jgi:hypothetical protein
MVEKYEKSTEKKQKKLTGPNEALPKEKGGRIKLGIC